MKPCAGNAIAFAILVVAAALAVTPGRGFAAADEVPVGPRAIALGGAFSSLADDATAIFWNPAGLARLGHQELANAHANLFHTGIVNNELAFALPVSPDLATAVDWYHSGYDDGELGFGENRVSFGGAMRLRSGLWAGASAKWITRTTTLDGFDVASEHGVGADAGLLLTPVERLRFALVAQDAFGTRLKTPDNVSELAYPRNLRFGASYSWRRAATLAFDLDDRWHAGLEVVPHPALALRVGTEADVHRVEGNTWTYGLGIAAGYLHLDWAHVETPSLDPTDHFAVSLHFNWNPAQVRIDKVQVRDLYASLYKSYSTRPIGSVTLRNLQDRRIDARLSVQIPELMSAPSQVSVILRPKVTTEVPLTAVIDPAVIAQRGDQPVQLRVEAAYQSVRLERRERAVARTVMYAPGAIDWQLGMDQAAAWVTPRDPAVEALARQAAVLVARRPHDAFGTRNVSFAAAVTDAAAAAGVTYVPDPNTPFASVSTTAHAVDTISYPYYTLQIKSGDCDDSTVLLASLLGNLGVETQFVDAPGHIFLLFDTGLPEENRDALGVDSTMTVVVDHQVWAPLETTALSKGFMQAWRIGADEVATWTAKGLIHYWDVGDAQTRYVPVTPPGERRIPEVDTLALGQRIDAEQKDYQQVRDTYFASHYGSTGHDMEVSAEALLTVASLDYTGGDFAGAKTQLEQALQKAPQSEEAHNDLAIVLAALGDWAGAAEQLAGAAALGGRKPGVLLNLGIARWALGDSLAGNAALAEGADLAGGLGPAMTLLGVAPAAPAKAAPAAAAPAGGAVSAEDWLRTRLTGAIQGGRTAAVRAISPRGRPSPAAGTAAPVPGSIPVPPDLHQHLYWIE